MFLGMVLWAGQASAELLKDCEAVKKCIEMERYIARATQQDCIFLDSV